MGVNIVLYNALALYLFRMTNISIYTRYYSIVKIALPNFRSFAKREIARTRIDAVSY